MDEMRLRAQKGMGSFRDRGKSLEYRFVYIDKYEQMKRKSVSGKTEEECIEKAMKFFEDLEKINRGVQVDATIPEILKRTFLIDFEKGYTGEQGYSRNLETLKTIERKSIGKKPIREIKEIDIDNFYKEVVNYSNNVIGKFYMMLKKAFTEAKKSGIITENIMDSGYSRPPKSKKNREKIRGLTEAEQKKLLETLQAYKVPVHGNTYKLQLLIELYTGMRMGEINSLKPEDIDFESGLIHVKRTVSRGLNDRHYINDVPKTQAGIRSIPMNKMARALLEEAVEKMKPNKEGLIFYDYRKDDIVTTTQVCNYYRRVCERAGIKYYGQHSLRHTFATRCIEAGVEALVLKEWLGHTNIHITLDTYSDVFNRMHDDAMEKFEKYITTEELK